MGKKIEYTNGEMTHYLATGALPACRYLRKNATERIPSQRKAMGTDRKRDHRGTDRTDQKMPFGSTQLQNE